MTNGLEPVMSAHQAAANKSKALPNRAAASLSNYTGNQDVQQPDREM